jgi:hypothetical protein
MFILYFYDIKARNKRQFNRTKRRFYYHLHKLPLKKEYWKTKSTLMVPTKLEQIMDSFFKRFGKSVEVYKVLTESVEELE